MIPLFDTENVVTPVVVQGLDVGGIGTQGVFGDDKLEMRMILAQLGDEAFGSIALAIKWLRVLPMPLTSCRIWRNVLLSCTAISFT
jgi:hypothetical protein